MVPVVIAVGRGYILSCKLFASIKVCVLTRIRGSRTVGIMRSEDTHLCDLDFADDNLLFVDSDDTLCNKPL